MNTHDVIGELLYIGLVAEKGRCYRSLRTSKGRKLLRNHICLLYELQQCLQASDFEITRSKIDKFIDVCNEEHEIGRFYQFTDKKTNINNTGESFKSIDKLIDSMLFALVAELQKFIIDRRYVHELLCALHNLPRVYLGTGKDTLCEINQLAITEQDAIKYSLSMMSPDMRAKYQKQNQEAYYDI